MNSGPGRPLRIVMIEDNPADVHLFRETMLEKQLDCELLVFDDGEEASEALQPGSGTLPPEIDMFVIDLNLPKVTGDELLLRLRRNEALGKVPVLVLTSSDSNRERERALQFGADEFLRKPCSLDDYFAIGDVIERLARQGRRVEAEGQSDAASETRPRFPE